MKKLLLHIGAPKTGSSFIQRTLKKNKDVLSNNGVVYFDNKYSAKVLRYLRSEDRNVDDLRIKTKYNKIICSNEGFLGNRETFFNDSQHYAEKLHNLFSDFDTTIVVLIRNQDMFIESLYSQTIKEGIFDKTFKEFSTDILSFDIDWSTPIYHFASMFKKVVVLRYEDFSTNNDIFFNHINKILGVECKFYIIDKIINPSIDRSGIKHMVSLAGTNKKKIKQKRRRMEKIFPKNVNDQFGLFADKDRDCLLNSYEDINKKLSEKFGLVL
jgi:hypothetical protein